MDKSYYPTLLPKPKREPFECPHCLAAVDICTLRHGVKLYDDENYDIISQQRMNGVSYLLGLRYLNRFNTTLIAEYYHNNIGLSKNEFRSYVAWLDRSLDSNNSESINLAKQDVSTTFRSKTLMQDYFYVKLIQPEPFSWLYSSISLFCIYNLTDHSFLISPQLSYKPYTNFEILLWPMLFFGGSETEYGSKQFKRKVEIWARFYF